MEVTNVDFSSTHLAERTDATHLAPFSYFPSTANCWRLLHRSTLHRSMCSAGLSHHGRKHEIGAFPVSLPNPFSRPSLCVGLYRRRMLSADFANCHLNARNGDALHTTLCGSIHNCMLRACDRATLSTYAMASSSKVSASVKTVYPCLPQQLHASNRAVISARILRLGSAKFSRPSPLRLKHFISMV
jgi:hypothetical protein